MKTRRRVPLSVWVGAGVVALHVGAFWYLADKHFLPKVKAIPAKPPENFSAGERTIAVDPVTGERTTESDFVVSTQLHSTPSPARK